MQLTMGKRICENRAAMRVGGAPIQGIAGWLLETISQIIRWKWNASPAKQKQMQVVETLALGPKKHLVLVSCGGERFLIGTGPESVHTIVRVATQAVELGALAEMSGASC